MLLEYMKLTSNLQTFCCKRRLATWHKKNNSLEGSLAPADMRFYQESDL